MKNNVNYKNVEKNNFLAFLWSTWIDPGGPIQQTTPDSRQKKIIISSVLFSKWILVQKSVFV